MFSQTSPFDKLLENATSSNLLEVDWGLIMEICDQITNEKVQPKYALNAIKKKILSGDPHISLYALQLLDACVSNCGLNFHLEVCSREFENNINYILTKGHPIVVEKMKEYIKRWSEQEFKDNPQLSLIPSLYNRLKKEGVKFKTTEQPKRKIQLSNDPNVVSSNQEEEDIAKAIELSLKESKSPKNFNKSKSSSLYPSISNGNQSNSISEPVKDTYKVRALYDFEAAEDNEITFKAGELLLVLDDSDSNWWKGANNRGEGLFPANFVTKNLEQEIESTKPVEKKTVQFNEEVRVKHLNTEVTEVDEAKIDQLLYLLHEADPTGERPDSEELSQLEEQCLKMGPLIDQELEVVDKTHASLSAVNSQLVEALNIYCNLMKENSAYSAMQSPYAQQQLPHPQISSNYNPALNQLPPHLSYGQPQMPYAQASYAPIPPGTVMSSMHPTGSIAPSNSAPYIAYSPAGQHQDNTSTTYTIPNQIHYGDINSQQGMQQQMAPINQPVIDSSGQQMPQNYSQQSSQPTSMALPTNR